ncbi:MAG: FAD-dependent thymidylate synthase [Methanothrix sp.]|nr:MAG: FAD-dependent thymidylate synthase [Methanothrix sp.]
MDGEKILKNIERAGRTCYKSEDLITIDSAKTFVAMILKRGHLSVIEHESISVKFVIDRGVSHEIVRHRLSSFSQESTRYCNYAKDKFGQSITVINIANHLTNKASFDVWLQAMEDAQEAYLTLIDLGNPPQIARSVLPNSLKTEIVVTCNLREWRLIFQQRTAAGAHVQMREVMDPLLVEFRKRIPVIFDNISDGN